MIGWLLFAAVAGAVESESDDPFDAAGVEEVTVWGQHALRQARSEVVRRMEDLGYTARDRGGDVVFRPPERWMGRVRFTREGELGFGRVVVALKSMQLHAHTYDAGTAVDAEDARATSASLDMSSTADDWAVDRGSEVVLAVPEVATWVLPSKQVLGSLHLRVLDAVGGSVETYRRVLWQTQVHDTLYSLASRLDALWIDGEPLVPGSDVADTPMDRRASVLDYWATRAESDEGRVVCDAVALWLRQTVQDSEHPATEQEIRQAEARRTDGAVLLLVD